MSLDVQKLTALLTSISTFNVTLRSRLETKLDANGTAANAEKLGGQTLAEILTDLDAASQTQLQALSDELAAFIARRDNPHAVTKEQVGLGNVQNFGTASDAEAVAAVAVDKLLTPANLAAFWADKVGAAPETLDTIAELSAALQNNPDAITALQSLVQENADDLAAMQLLVDTKLGQTGLDLIVDGADKTRYVAGTPTDIGNVTLVTGVAAAAELGIADAGFEAAVGVLTVTSGSTGGVITVSRKFVTTVEGQSVSFDQVGTSTDGWAAWSRVMRTTDQSSDAATLGGFGPEHFATADQLAATQADHEAGFQSLIDEMNLLAASIEA
jgi:hypothetical protein